MQAVKVETAMTLVSTAYCTADKKRSKTAAMPLRPKLTPVEVFERLQLRLERRIQGLQHLKWAGHEMVMSELEVELELLRRAQRYLEE